MADIIVTRAPTRIDFGGGWTDVPPFSDELGGFVCNVAIARYATVTVSRRASDESSPRSADGAAIADAAARRFDVADARIVVQSDFPVGAGLGGSSAAGVATVAALAALTDRPIERSAMAELSRDIEIEDLGIAGGRQDHYAAAWGGALGLRFARSGVDVHRIPLSTETRAELERRCVVVYTGQSRISGDTIDAVIGAYRRGEPRVLGALQQMKAGAELMAAALAAGDIDRLGALVDDQWTHQRSLHPAIPTSLIDEIIAAAGGAGALGAKALGASGGGCVLAVAASDTVDAVRGAISGLGEPIDFSVDSTGVMRCP